MVVALGQPRNGTSMLMRVLEFGGVPIEHDTKLNTENKHKTFGNPYGFYETGNKNPDKCFKVWFWRRMEKLPLDTKYIYIERDFEQVMKSWENVSNKGVPVDLEIRRKHAMENRQKMRELLMSRPHILIEYDDLQTNPRLVCEKIKDFIKDEVDFDVDKAVLAVDKSLYVVR